MFCVIYRGFIYPERESEYLSLWNIIAGYFITNCGALGSCLHKTIEGEYIAYSRWPDRQTRDFFWKDNKCIPLGIAKAIDDLKLCIDTSKPHDEIYMDAVSDLLIRPGIKIL